MKRAISRRLYKGLLGLHPEHFRMEFGDEMLEIFEYSSAEQGVFFVLADVIKSAAKQQVRYHTAPAPESSPLYSETPETPALARMLACSVLVLTLAASAGISGGKVKPHEFQITRTQPRLLFTAFSIGAPQRRK